MKSILLIETPESCEECPLRSYSNLTLWCTPLRKTKEEWDECPLKPMPMKRETLINWYAIGGIGGIPTHEISEYDKGWNDCVDYFEGEGDHND